MLLRDQALRLHALMDLVASRVGSRLGSDGANRLLREGDLLGSARATRAHRPDAARLERAFTAASRTSLGRTSCFPRARALRRYLRRHGLPGQLRLGFRRENGRLKGHAWVELDGRVVGDDADFVRSFIRLKVGRQEPAGTCLRREEA